MNRTILWQKWEEPWDFGNAAQEEIVEDDSTGERIKKIPFLVKQTTYGFVGVRISASLKTDFEFWVGNTNFDITQEIMDIIENTEGVEILDLWGPYKFRFSPGIAFTGLDKNKRNKKTKIIQRRIERNLGIERYKFRLSKDMRKAIIDLKSSPYWLLYALDEEKFEEYHTRDKKEFENTLENYKIAKNMIGGRLEVGGIKT